MTTLRVIVDQIVAPHPGGVGRYTEELTRALIATAPAGADVAGVVSASTEPEYERIATLLPGLSGLYKSALARRELERAWQHGLTSLPGKGMVHATGMLAPLSRHDRINDPGNQIAVTLHDTVPWHSPESLPARRVSWYRGMLKRAHKHADAVVVPTHAVAAQLRSIADFGDRVRVIGGAVSPKLQRPVDAAERATALGLPNRYLLAMGPLLRHKAIDSLATSLAEPALRGIPLLLAGVDDASAAELATAAGVEGRVTGLGRLDDADLAVAIGNAAVFVAPSLLEGFGLPVLEAFSLGTPVVHSDDEAMVEVAGGAGVIVAREDGDGYPRRLAEAIRSVLDDEDLARRLRLEGSDRARLFSWTDSAERVWQLHADL